MSVLDILNPIKGIASLIKPVADLIDSVHTSSEEKGELSSALARLQFEMASQVIGYQMKALEADIKLKDAQRDIIVSEAKSDSLLARIWRPIVMLAFAGIVVHSHIVDTVIDDKLYYILLTGLGGYIGARSTEKIVPKIIQVIRETRTK